MLSKTLAFLFLFLIILSSCNTSNKVISSSFIQKRKYTKGYHLDLFAKTLKHSKHASENNKPFEKKKSIIPNDKVAIIPKINHPLFSQNIIQQNRDNDLIASIDKRMIVVNKYNNFFVGNDSTKVIKPQDSSASVNNQSKNVFNLFIALLLMIL